tara:strand:+ start:351 stop:1211 length:861 start_codon:yes stop_codon:yes gene_type:complete
MKIKEKIGVIGAGFVGSSVRFGFSPQTNCDAEVLVNDKKEELSTHSLLEIIEKCSIIFISVPTPSNPDGSVNTDIINNLFEDILEIEGHEKPIFLLRSTVVPGTCQSFSEKFPALKLVFNPEFLTERSAKLDFINQSRYILGSNHDEYIEPVANLYKQRFGSTISIIRTNFETAELIKYMNNCFFATKVSFMNEMYMIAEKSGADWDMAVEGFVRDGRIGHSHLAVPGHDGKFGFGGSCFPKDMRAIIAYAESIGIDLKTLSGAWETNLEVRPEKDWEKLKGRAVV